MESTFDLRKMYGEAHLHQGQVTARHYEVGVVMAPTVDRVPKVDRAIIG
jgi:hypothetical protein